MKKANNKGFTLIELLATISILAIIMLIAIPNVVGIVQKNKNKQYIEDAKKFIAIAKYNVRLHKPTTTTTYKLNFLDKSQEIKEAPNGGEYDREKSTVTVTKKDNKFVYTVSLYEKKDGKLIGLEDMNEDNINNNNISNSVKTIEIKKVCKRATELHNDGVYTYGNLGKEGTLTAGDAFDCDVNNDGTYNKATERFYYISQLDNDNSYAVLNFYNSVKDGKPSAYYSCPRNTGTSSYDYYQKGPTGAILLLPKTSQWSNVKLSNVQREIKDQYGDNLLYYNFSYDGYAARLLTSQEVAKACTSPVVKKTDLEIYGIESKCNYLFENTKYSDSSKLDGYWLENGTKNNGDGIVIVYNNFGGRTYLGDPLDKTTYGVRPAIEVPISDIEY